MMMMMMMMMTMMISAATTTIKNINFINISLTCGVESTIGGMPLAVLN